MALVVEKMKKRDVAQIARLPIESISTDLIS
jgi:hypothetical protein